VSISRIHGTPGGPGDDPLARPTSITTDCDPSTTRVMVLSQARRWTVVAEIGSENSSSPAGDPANPRSVSSVVVT